MLVDVVVRDKRGQPVRDLTQADFEVLEDGVPQTIGSFTPVRADGRRRRRRPRRPPPPANRRRQRARGGAARQTTVRW